MTDNKYGLLMLVVLVVLTCIVLIGFYLMGQGILEMKALL